MKRPLLLLLAFACGVAPGCGTLFFHNPQTVRVTSNVPGSLVIAKDEGILGRTSGLSGEFKLDRSKDHTLLVSAHGNEASTVIVVSHFSWWRILISLGGDIFLGCIPLPPVLYGVMGGITDLGSGSWQVLDDDVAVSLKPRNEFEPNGEVWPAPSTEQPTSAPAPAAPKRCFSCNTPVDASAQFCPQCGSRLEGVTVKPCPICGEPRPVGSATCPHCGLK